MRSKALHMETTQIAASKTVADIVNELVAAGARQIATDYGSEQSVVGLRWVFLVGNQPAVFAMPARVDPIYKILRSRRRGHFGAKDETNLRAQAERVAWRQLLRWVQAQIAMIQTGMVDAAEVFAPFLLQVESGQTLWQHLTATRFKALPAPEQEQR